MSEIYIDEAGCTVTPAIEPVPASPARVVEDGVFAWNAGGNSVATLLGKVARFSFTVPTAQGAVTGVSRTRRVDVNNPGAIDFGFYCFINGATPEYVVTENGVVLTSSLAFTPTDVFAVWQIDGAIIYSVNNVAVHRSAQTYRGAVTAGTALYATGDTIDAAVFEVLADAAALIQNTTFEALLTAPLDGVATLGAALIAPLDGIYSPFTSRAFLSLPADAIAALGAALDDPTPSVVSTPVGFVPRVSRAALEDFAPTLYAETFVNLYSEFDLELPVDAIASLGAALTLPTEDVATGLTEPDAFFFIVQSEGYLSMWAGSSQSISEDSLTITDVPVSDVINVVMDRLLLTDRTGVFERVILAAQSDITFTDRVVYLVEMLTTSNLTLTDSTAIQRAVLAAVTDELLATSIGTTQQTVTLAVATAMALSDLARFGYDLNATSTLTMTDVLATMVAVNLTLLDTLALTDSLVGDVTFNTMVSDALELTDTTSLTALLNMPVSDELLFSIRVRIGDDTYIGYAVNLSTAAASEYDNFPVNSFGSLNRRLYGALPDGIYLLEGSDDAGAEIAAALRTGLSNFGVEQLKKTLQAYIGYTSNGRLVIKTITTNDGGANKRESWYQLNPRAPDSTSDNRFTVAKGLDAVYWQYELVNIDGAEFSVDNIKLVTLPLQRRYTGR